MGAQTMASNKLYINETIGSLSFLPAGVQALLGHKSMDDTVHFGWFYGSPSVCLLTNISIDFIVCE